MPDDLKGTLLKILNRQEASLAALAMILADLEALKLVLAAVHPEAHELLQKTLQANRDRYAQELARSRSDNALLRSTVSKLVQ